LVQASATQPTDGAFGASRERFEAVVAWLDGAVSARLSHAELEERLQDDGRQLLRQLLQDHLDERAQREQRLVDVADAAGVEHPYAESGHTSSLATVFGQVSVARIAYRTLDWYCCPRFDSPSVFAALLDADHGGLFRISPDGDRWSSSSRRQSAPAHARPGSGGPRGGGAPSRRYSAAGA
jgi:hypothetical protein